MENSSGRGADGTSRDSYGCNEKGFIVACGSGALEVLEVQPESKKRMEAKVFCNGRGVEPGTVLGNIEG